MNKWLRSKIKGLGYQCLHVKEADIPGPLDLLAWLPGSVHWIELKLDDRAVEPSQIEFMRAQRREGVSYCVVRFRGDTEIFEVSSMQQDGKLYTDFSTPDDIELLNYILG